MSNGQPMSSLSSLLWLVDAGADEAVGEVPVDRFQRQTFTLPSWGGSAIRRSRDGWGSPRPSLPTPKTFGIADRRSRGGSARPNHSPPLLPRSRPTASPPRIEIAARAQTLAELKAALESFDGSELKKRATTTVFADGNPDAGILFIGEAPGFDEDKAGVPFVGRAGKLLDRMLAAIGLDRSSAYIINVMPWRPPDNRNPDPGEVAMCIPFLRRHIELARPRRSSSCSARCRRATSSASTRAS